MIDNRIRTVVVVKEAERYVFRFTNANRKDLLVALARYARDPRRSFTWNDAVRVAQATATPAASTKHLRADGIRRRVSFHNHLQNE